MSKKVDLKEVGLDLGLILSKSLFRSEYLHYGIFSDGLEPAADTVHQAQAKYAQFLLDKIPGSVKSIFDVGCGSGAFAIDLLNAGYAVDCVSPHPFLTKHVREKVGNRSEIFQCGYEEVNTSKTYDMVLFSESFQYIPLEYSLPNIVKHLKPGGYLLICDFFRRTGVEGTSPIGGGHDMEKFYQMIDQYPLTKIEDIDITKETAPSIDFVDNFLHDVINPIWHMFWYVLDNNYPKIAKFLKWKFKKKLDKVNYKYLTGNTNGEAFAKFKEYHFLLYQKS